MILIVTNQRDVTSDLVVLQLQCRGLPYVRFNSEDFLTRGGLSWEIDGSLTTGELHHRGKSLDLHAVSAVWFRRPLAPQPSPQFPSGLARRFAVQEGEATVRNLWALLDCLWVSRPEAILRAGQKLAQLRAAAELGFETPPTLLTTDPDRARVFCRAHGDVVAKPLGGGAAGRHDGTRIVIYANRLQPHHLERLDTVAGIPTLFQRLIRKGHDLRVTVVGRRVFATEIWTRGSGDESVDWRREPVENLHHVSHTLPAAVESRILDLVRRSGLQFSALDFVVDQDGRYVFLELNPNGQWAWIEQLVGTPISAALADLLSLVSPPL